MPNSPDDKLRLGAARANKVWRFVERVNSPARWTWQLLGPDGAIAQESEQFNSYGDAIAHAIRFGFRPSDDHWVVEGLHTVTHFTPQNTPVVIPRNRAERKSS
jgi:hypothetical protein